MPPLTARIASAKPRTRQTHAVESDQRAGTADHDAASRLGGNTNRRD
jgi:hypothetical protein